MTREKNKQFMNQMALAQMATPPLKPKKTGRGGTVWFVNLKKIGSGEGDK